MAEEKRPNGFTIGIYLPSGVTEEQINRVFDAVSASVYGELREDRGNWDPFIVGHRGDILSIDHEGHDCCPPHVYFSTGCFHGNHDYCKAERGLIGNKTPACCKFCQAPCVCRCHADREGDSVDGVKVISSASEGEGTHSEGNTESG
jgi:hypothetical protein